MFDGSQNILTSGPFLVLEHGHCGRLPEEVEGSDPPLGDPVQLGAGLDQREGVAKGAPDLLELVHHPLPDLGEQPWRVLSPEHLLEQVDKWGWNIVEVRPWA